MTQQIPNTTLQEGVEVSRQVSHGVYFFDTVPGEGPADDGIHAIYGGMEECAPYYRIEREGFPYRAMEFVIGGEGELILNGRRHVLRAGTIFSYGPNCTLRIRTEPANVLHKYFVCMQGVELGRALAAAGLGEGQCRRMAEPFEIQRCWDHLIADGRALRRGRREVCGAQLRLLLVKLAHMADVGVLPAGGGAESTFLRCRGYIDQHAARLDSVAAVTAETGVARAHLSRLFRRFQGESPYRYLVRRRMSLAAERLMKGDCRVKEAARHIGMSDPYHFSRLFKEVYKVAPSAFVREVVGSGNVVADQGSSSR